MGLGRRKWQPLQCSCLQNPVDRRAWWAAVHGVTQSCKWLKRLSMRGCVGEGTGSPLQYSCLENPVHRGAWWAAVHGVTQSQTWLKRLSMHAVGEGNGNLLQCSCLENPRDRGAWWAAVYGVTQSRTWLKWLSSSSSSKPIDYMIRDKSPHWASVSLCVKENNIVSIPYACCEDELKYCLYTT